MKRSGLKGKYIFGVHFAQPMEMESQMVERLYDAIVHKPSCKTHIIISIVTYLVE